MPKQKRIHVTTADIENGKCLNEDECPIALALHRAYPKLNFLVGTKCILLLARGIPTDKYLLPPRITEWINDYDDLHDVKPIEFTFPFLEE